MNIYLFLLFFFANMKPIIYDYGNLLSNEKYSQRCIIKNSNIDIYGNNQLSCDELNGLFDSTIYDIQQFFLIVQKKTITFTNIQKKITIRIISLHDLNNPKNFLDANPACMNNIRCNAGAYLGRCFCSKNVDNVNVYIVYHNYHVPYQYSFISVFKHEIMHVLLCIKNDVSSLDIEQEHKIIDKFLKWMHNK